MLEAVPSTDIWTGGNLCPDSPAPQDSMWTDGSANKETHFARVSGLGGERCCVKAGRRGWKGEPCSVLLYGVSYDFEDDIDRIYQQIGSYVRFASICWKPLLPC